MAISYLGNRYSGAIPFSLATDEVPCGFQWIEAEPVVQITAHKVQHFVWKIIVCRFGVPKRLVPDNGTQFANQ